MKTQVSIDDRQLFVCGVIDKNFEEVYMEEVNESVDKCYEQVNRGEFAWDDGNNCRLDQARVREAPKAKVEYFQKSTRRYQSRSARWRQERCRSKSGGLTHKQDEANPPSTAVGSSQRLSVQ